MTSKKKQVILLWVAIIVSLALVYQLVHIFFGTCVLYSQGYRNKLTGKCSTNYAIHCEPIYKRIFFTEDRSCYPPYAEADKSPNF